MSSHFRLRKFAWHRAATRRQAAHLNVAFMLLLWRRVFQLFSIFKYVDYTPAEISLLNWAVSGGTILATAPFTLAYNRVGARFLFFFAGFLSGFATIAMPFAAVYSHSAMAFLRFVQGIAYASDFALVGILCSRWASLKQNGIFIAVLTSYTPLSSALTDSLGGMVLMRRRRRRAS